MHPVRLCLKFLAVLTLVYLNTLPVAAQTSVELKDVKVEYVFGEKINFSATIETKAGLESAYLLFQAENDPNTHTQPITVNDKGKAVYVHFIQNGIIRPFAKVEYWYHLTLADKSVFDSKHFSFQYDDNRYLWQKLQNGILAVHWVEGDVAFGQAALDTARAGLAALNGLVPSQAGNPIQIYIYSTAADVQMTLNLGGYAWAGGHASPDIGVVLVSIAPGENQAIEMERQIPHELAHVLLYRLTGSGYANIPTWYLEGIASEAERYPNANYAQVLSVASKSQALLPISNLCGPFPADASGAMLAYAESDSFTRYLNETFGTTRMQALLKNYVEGLTCEEGVGQALGKPLAQVEQDWRRNSLGEKTSSAGWQNMAPYLLILLLVLVIPAWRLFGTPKRGSYDRRQPR